MRGTLSIVALLLFVNAASARAATVRVVLDSRSASGATGLLVPGAGSTVSREEALAALRPLPSCTRGCDYRISLGLPPRGLQHNVRRYPVSISGRGYEHGILVSSRTRIPGVVAALDIRPTVRALERGDEPPVTARADPHPQATLAHLDRRLLRAHDARDPAMLVMISLLTVYGLAGLALRSRLFALAAVLVPPVAMSSALVLSAAGAERPPLVVTVLGIATAVGSLAGAAVLRDPRALGVALAAFFVAYLVVMWAWPVTNSLAVIGPHPDGGGRYYGVTNEMSTLMLAPAFLAAALLGPVFFVPVALLALVTVGASFSGADGGGAVTLIAGFLVLALRESGAALTWRRLVAVGAATAVAAVAFVGLDAAAGGSSHVTRAVGGGPGTLAGDLGHRFHVSWNGATSSWYHVLLLLIAFSALALVATRRPREPVVDALLVAVAVSLLVNDTPVDVAGFGALSALTLWSWLRLERLQ